MHTHNMVSQPTTAVLVYMRKEKTLSAQIIIQFQNTLNGQSIHEGVLLFCVCVCVCVFVCFFGGRGSLKKNLIINNLNY